MLPLNYIRAYYGEKLAFYFAWLIHYIGWLIVAALIGVIFFIIMFIRAEDKSSIYDIMNSDLNGIYAVIMILWSTLFIESWKRKQNRIASIWYTRNLADSTADNKNFVYALEVNPEIKSVWKINPKNTVLNFYCVSVPIVISFICLVFFIQYILGFWRDFNKETYNEENPLPFYMEYGPFVTNALIIIYVGGFFGMASRWMTKRENHRYQ